MEGLNLKHQSRGGVLTWPPSCMGCKHVHFQANNRNWTCDLLIEAKRPLPLSQIGAKQEFNVFPLQSFMSVLIVSLYIYLLFVLFNSLVSFTSLVKLDWKEQFFIFFNFLGDWATSILFSCTSQMNVFCYSMNNSLLLVFI